MSINDNAAKTCKHEKNRPDSYWMNDAEIVFKELDLQEGDYFLDLGCGIGNYSLHACKEVGDTGQVIAIEKQSNVLEELLKKAEKIKNIKVIVSDITKPLAVEDNSIDVCLISTVLHCFDLNKDTKVLFSEIYRLLKPGSRLVIIECNKEDLTKGPPLYMRISSDEIEEVIKQYGFQKLKNIDLGFNYLVQFKKI